MFSRKWICILLVSVLLTLVGQKAYAFSRGTHDEQLELVLFGDANYKSSHPKTAEIIQALEDASYLALDQFNGSGVDELANLRSRKIKGLPKSISEIDFKGNSAHRQYTHRGWNVEYESSEAHWPTRKQILINTIDKELFQNYQNTIEWINSLGQKITGNRSNERLIDSFAMLIYYVHVLGDHIHAERYTQLAFIDQLTNPNDRDNPGIIPDLKQAFSILFESQKSSRVYGALMQDLDEIAADSNRLRSSRGGVNTDEKFIEYHECATRLLETLSTNVPLLLQKEEYFSRVFYSLD